MTRYVLASVFLVLVLATSTPAETLPGKIAFVGLDHQIYLVDPNGGEPRALTRGEPGRLAIAAGWLRHAAQEEKPPSVIRFAYPTWAPDGETLLALGTRLIGERVVQQAGVYRVGIDATATIVPLFEDEKRSPIYAFWAPDGGEAAVLVTDGGGISLGIVGGGAPELRPIGSGFPFYFAWNTDSRFLLSHVGGAAAEGHPAEVRLFDVRGRDERARERQVTDEPVLFRAPAWSPDGRQFAFAARRKDRPGAALWVQSKDGQQKREIAPVASQLVFSWTPGGGSLTVAESGSPDSSLFAGVNLVHLADGRREPLYAGAVSAFFWSPDGSRLLVATPEFDSAEWRWLVIDRASRQAREVARFFTSPELQMLMQHFDQYALSHRLWSPDSRYFTFAGYPTRAKNEGEPVPPTVWVVDTDTAKVKRLADGRAAFWSPR